MTARSPHVDDRDAAATTVVATAFARIVAERYPGASWQPVRLSGGDGDLIEPARKIIRLVPSDPDDKSL
jgi:hypothetical protein